MGTLDCPGGVKFNLILGVFLGGEAGGETGGESDSAPAARSRRYWAAGGMSSEPRVMLRRIIRSLWF